jgi:hypothetical protein
MRMKVTGFFPFQGQNDVNTFVILSNAKDPVKF